MTLSIVPKHPEQGLKVLAFHRASVQRQTSDGGKEKQIEGQLQKLYPGQASIEHFEFHEPEPIGLAGLGQLIEHDRIDLVIAEDATRIDRRVERQIAFVQACVDAGVRVLFPGDGFDSADPDWRTRLIE